MERFARYSRAAWRFRRTVVIVAAPALLAALLPNGQAMGLNEKATNCLYVLLLMACYWATEAVDIAATALLPLALFPLLGVMSAETTAKHYLKDTSVLLIGGLLLAVALEKCGVQKRVALSVLRLVGTGERMLLLAFMLSTWFVSMWISNTATAAMMITIVQSVLAALDESPSETIVCSSTADVSSAPVAAASASGISEAATPVLFTSSDSAVTLAPVKTSGSNVSQQRPLDAKRDNLGKALSLCVAYSATIGGMATLTGTGTNLILVENLQSLAATYPDLVGVTFSSWMVIGVPLSLVLVALGWLWLQLFFFGCRPRSDDGAQSAILKRVIREERKALGKIRFSEIVVGLHLLLVVALWLTRDIGDAGGWGAVFKSGYVKDGTVVIAVALSLFIMPSEVNALSRKKDGSSRGPCKPAEACLTWKDAEKRLPWGVIVLLGGGFALAEGVTESGLSAVIGQLLASSVRELPDWAMVAVMATITAALTEVASNMAIVSLFLPIVAKAAISVGKNPLYLMFPTCFAASFAFMLPVATPPNAIVFSTGVLKVSDMAKAGAVMNIIGIGAVTLSVTTWGSSFFLLNEWNALTSITSSTMLANISTLTTQLATSNATTSPAGG